MKALPIAVTVFALLSSAAIAENRDDTMGQGNLQARAEQGWRAITEADVEAAYRLLSRNHPGALAEARDPAFVSNLNEGYKKALQRARSVKSLSGYSATLRGFANTMGDGHIWSSPTFAQDKVHWAGIIMAKRGENWTVVNEDQDIVGANIIGSTLQSCDVISANQISDDILSFWTVKGNRAMQTMRAAMLFIDNGNPFIRRPKSCDFKTATGIKTIALQWKETSRAVINKYYMKPVSGSAGFGVRSVADGFWVSIQTLDPRAQAVIDSVSSDATRIRYSSYIVIDLRGNGGGNDQYGRKLADAIYGAEYVTDRLGPIENGCPSVFRASADNIDSTEKQIHIFEDTGDRGGARIYAAGLKAMKQARSDGKDLTGPITCKTNSKPKVATSPSNVRGKVYTVTDVACFSFCINTVGWLRELGAIQVGQITGNDTHYGEVREITLPSGLSTFSTMMALMPDAPAEIGPFSPTIPYDGDISDTAALEAWLSAQAVSH